jgi:hypothetical protein
VQLMSMVVKTNMVYMINKFKVSYPMVNSTFHHTLLNFRITIDFHCMHTVSTKCSQRGTSMPPVQSAFWDLHLFAKAIHTGMTGQQTNELLIKYQLSSKLNLWKLMRKSMLKLLPWLGMVSVSSPMLFSNKYAYSNL